MSNPPDTVPLAEYEAVRQLHQTALRQLHRWQTGTQIESDYIQHWVTRAEFEESEKRNEHLVKELAKSERLRVDQLEDRGKRIFALQGELYRARSDRDQYKSEFVNVQEECKGLHGECARLRSELAEAKADSKAPAWDQYHGAVARAEGLRKHADELIEQLKETDAKRANYKREVRRLQDALLRQRGQQRWAEIERLEQRVQALEGSRRGSPTAALEIFDQLRELERRIVRNAGRVSRENKPRWSHVLDVTAHGSTVSADMCRRHGVDPDELIGGEE